MQDKNILFENLMDEYISGSITDEGKDILFAFLEESDVYRKRYNELIKLYALLHVPALETQKENEYKHFKKKLHSFSGSTSGHTTRLISIRNIAAIILLIITVSISSIFTYKKLDQSGDQLFNETIVPLGSQTKILLPDGSTAVLNSGSILKYPLSYGKKERNVYLVGEGYFEVAKNTEKAFQVYAGDTKIKVTGTIFNVRAYLKDNTTKISLIEGSVSVYANNKFLHLAPNEKAIYNRETRLLYSEATDAQKEAAWTNGRLSFVNTSFIEILKDIERKYNVKIHVESKKAAKEYFSGSINLEMTLQEVFNFIDVDKKYCFEMNGNTILLKDK